MSSKKFKTSSRFKLLSKSERKYIESLINKWYTSKFFDILFEIAENHHPLDLITYFYKYSLAKNKEDMLIRLFDDYAQINFNSNVTRIPKSELAYIIEWVIKIRWVDTFKSKNIDTNQSKRLIQLLLDITNEISNIVFYWSWLVTNLRNAVNFWDEQSMRLASSQLYQWLYHQLSVNEHSYKRLDFIMESWIWEEIFENYGLIRKHYSLYLVLIYCIVTYGWWVIINLNEALKLLNNQLSIKVAKDDIINFISYYGCEYYDEYEKWVVSKDIRHFFGKNQIQNICNQEILIRDRIFNISNQIWTEEEFYLIDSSNSCFHLLNRLIAEDTLKKKLLKSRFYEDYCTALFHSWVDSAKSTKYSSSFQYGNSVIIKEDWLQKGEIDFFIFNKDTGYLLIFEIKDRTSLWKNIFKLDTIEHLVSNDIPWRKQPWDIYQGMKQLNKFYTDIEYKLLKDKLWLTEDIKDIKCFFLVSNETFCWNAIMKPMLAGKFSIPDTCYDFISLSEFETTLSVGFKKGIDLIDIFCSKNTLPIVPNESLEIIKSRLFSNNIEVKLSDEYTSSVYQDFDSYLHKKYHTDKIGWIFPHKWKELEKTLTEAFGSN